MTSKILKRIDDYLKNRTYFEDNSYIQWADREGITYHENHHTLYLSFLFDWEASSARARILFVNDISNSWLPPFNDELLSTVKKKEILEKIVFYSKDQNFSLKVSYADPDDLSKFTLPSGTPPSKFPIGSSDGNHRK